MSFLGFGKPNVAKLKARKNVKRLISELRSKNDTLKAEVCDALAEIGPDAVPLLSRAVAEGQNEVRIAALLTLARIPGEQAFATIKAALKNSSFEVRKEAARILGGLGDPNALEELLCVPLSEVSTYMHIGS